MCVLLHKVREEERRRGGEEEEEEGEKEQDKRMTFTDLVSREGEEAVNQFQQMRTGPQ